MRIRKATKKDFPEIMKVIKSSFHHHYGAPNFMEKQFVNPNYATTAGPYYSLNSFVESMIKDLKGKFKKPFKFFVAENGKKSKKIIGFIILENSNGKFWINNAMVKKEYQNKGIGKKLFNAVSKNEGLYRKVNNFRYNKKPIYLWVNVKNPAIKFWRKFGFREILRESLMRKE